MGISSQMRVGGMRILIFFEELGARLHEDTPNCESCA